MHLLAHAFDARTSSCAFIAPRLSHADAPVHQLLLCAHPPAHGCLPLWALVHLVPTPPTNLWRCACHVSSSLEDKTHAMRPWCGRATMSTPLRATLSLSAVARSAWTPIHSPTPTRGTRRWPRCTPTPSTETAAQSGRQHSACGQEPGSSTQGSTRGSLAAVLQQRGTWDHLRMSHHMSHQFTIQDMSNCSATVLCLRDRGQRMPVGSWAGPVPRHRIGAW